MAGGKKKKKPVSNPARGFATISIASKPKVPTSDPEALLPLSETITKEEPKLILSRKDIQPDSFEENLTPEEFERRLEESELQVLVDKHAQKSKRDAQRQISRLGTDQRVLRGQAETLLTKKWLPPELMEEILQLIKAEGRFAGLGDTSGCVRQASQETLIVQLLTLQQVLMASGFPEKKVSSSLQHVLNVSDRIGAGTKDMIWGLEESLNWLSRECSREELPDYCNINRNYGGLSKSSCEKTFDSPNEVEISTPHQEPDVRHVKTFDKSGSTVNKSKQPSSVAKTLPIDYESDIDPDDLLPLYLDCKTKIFNLEKSRAPHNQLLGHIPIQSSVLERSKSGNLELAGILRKLKKIEDDVLFDKYVADQQWEIRRVQMEKELSRLKDVKASQDISINSQIAQTSIASNDEVNQEAARISQSILDKDECDNDDVLGDFFSSLPVNEIDPKSGKTTSVIEDNGGVKVTIRDFGKWLGVNPTRLLEEACRSRDSSVKLSYTLVSESSFSNRHSLRIYWSKAQQITCKPSTEIDYISSPKSQCFIMSTISTPDSKQSEAYIATTALFCLFSSSREEKILNRLPTPWKDLCSELSDYNKELVDEVDRGRIRVFRDMVREKRDRELEEGVLIQGAFKNRSTSRAVENEETGGDKINRIASASESLKRIWFEKSDSPTYKMMLQSRIQLPIWKFREKVLDIIDREQIVIICGETGCGKSTQVPSFILENQLSKGEACKIYVTEPRRLSAISLARRVGEELGERKGDLGTNRSLVGYAIRLESNISKETCLVYATTGIVMRMLESSNGFNDITHIILDEVHERTIDSDFLLIVLKKLLAKRHDLKVILMSATVDADRFSKYLDGAPVLNVPGRTYPVQVKFLEDVVELTGYSIDNRNQERLIGSDEDLDISESTLKNSARANCIKALSNYSNRTRNTIAQIDEYRIDFELITQLLIKISTDSRFDVFSGAILIFLPGIFEIRQLNDMLVGHPAFSSNWHIYPLHSSIANEDQEAAFLIPLPGTRKIVLATNIAETGITIPDVTCVIDTGKHREMRFDERRQLSRLLETFISRANAKQRRGRAGRVQEGLCFHMFTKYRHDNLMTDQQTPELLRLSLQDLAIRVKICKLGSIEDTLSQALDPPLPKNVRRAIDTLVDVRALTPGEDLTPLGAQLARLPLDVFLGKLVILGLVFKCLDASITIAAILSSKSPFSAPFGARAQADLARHAFKRGDSDLLTAYNAYIAWKRVCMNGGASEYQFCRKNFLSQQTLANIEDLKGQLIICLVDSGFLPLTDTERASLNRARFPSKRRHFFDVPQRSSINSENDLITASVVVWSFYPKLLVRDGKGFRNCANNQSISIHPSSVNKGCNEIKWLSYYHIMQAKQRFYNAHETTATEDFSVALLCGDARCDMNSGVIILDGNRARFSISDWKTMLVIKTLRARLREILSRSYKSPGKPLTIQQQKWMEIWQKIFSQRSNTDDK
ncbi:ATP-dependent RNA helicase DHX29 [Golovinomyces cichoracearum]|uniref:RNA helicase n=1 Tax=Golovinomyces cichoracearum TaxID=62708 RepID=A0A420IQ00_9PEZI|nr:ATP-dependent RNA helicase DHX29 [Golovinomyces cichoracearum]